MKTKLSVLVLVGLIFFIGFAIGKAETMSDTKYTLKTYTGVGSGVFKHGTIVKVDDKGNVIPVGHFDDDSGKDYPGTVQIEKVQE